MTFDVMQCALNLREHSLSHLCVGSALHRRTSSILSQGTLLLHGYYSAPYLIALFCPGGVAGPPNADCYPTAPRIPCGLSDDLEWFADCAASDASRNSVAWLKYKKSHHIESRY